MSELANVTKLYQVHSNCVSANTLDADDVKAWIESVGIDPDAWDEFIETMARGSSIAGRIAMQEGVSPEIFLSAVFSAGFETGVRWQQTRQLEEHLEL